ncbi:MAG: hypothetical protein WA635_06760 [Gallionella sp.]
MSVEQRAYSISDFCKAYGFSRATFYNLQKSGQAPDTLKIGKRPIITIEAADRWQKKLEAQSREAQAA